MTCQLACWLTWLNCWLILNNYWMRQSIIWRIMEIEEGVIGYLKKWKWQIYANSLNWRICHFITCSIYLWIWKKSFLFYRTVIDLVTVFDAILTSRQACEKLQCWYENLMSNNFRKTAVLNKNISCKLKLQSKDCPKKIFEAYLSLNLSRGLL